MTIELEHANDVVRTRYIAIFDVLGFKQLIEGADLDHVRTTLLKFEKLAHDLRTWRGIGSEEHLEIRWFQDTVLVMTNDASPPALAYLIQYATALLAFAFSDGILLRGGICSGEVFATPSAVIGKPIIAAYGMEQAQDWMGCWIEKECIAGAGEETRGWISRSGLVFPYPVPMKHGPVRSEFVLNWPLVLVSLGSGIEVLETAWRRFLESSKSWDVERKVQNMDAFLRFLVAKKWNPSRNREGRQRSGPGHWLADYELYSALPEYRAGNPSVGQSAAHHSPSKSNKSQATETAAPAKRKHARTQVRKARARKTPKK